MDGIELLEKRIRILEHSMIKTVHSIEKQKNTLNDELTINHPITFIPLSIPLYKRGDIGYKINNTINENIEILSGVENLISSIILPCYGVWMVTYRLEINLSLGFTCLRSSKVIVNKNIENSNLQQIINDINTVNVINHSTTTINNSIIYSTNDNNFNLNLFVNFTFGRLNSSGIFNIVSNNTIPIFSVTRIA